MTHGAQATFTDGSSPAPGKPSAPARRGPVSATLVLGTAVGALNSTVVSTAIPLIVADFGGFSALTWLFSGYLLTTTATLPVYGKLSDNLGRRPVLIAGIVLFLTGSLLCAGAGDMTSLIAFRMVQGLGIAAVEGTVQTIIADQYSLEDRPRIQARLSTVWSVCAICGPLLGGFLATCVGWRWIFLVNAPVAVTALWLVTRHLPDPARTGPAVPGVRRRSARDTDWGGALAVFACGAALLTFLVQGGVTWPWLSFPSLALLGACLLFAVALVVIEHRADDPVMPGWVWRRRVIVVVNVALGLVGLLISVPVVFLPMYGQSVLGLGPVAAGLGVSAMLLAWSFSAHLAHHVHSRIGLRRTALIGIGAASLTLLALGMLSSPDRVWCPTLAMLLLGGALGLVHLPLVMGAQSSVAPFERGTTTASLLFCRKAGQCLGAAVFGALANNALRTRLDQAPDSITTGVPSELDSVTKALRDPASLSPQSVHYLHQAIDGAVDQVYLGASIAAALGFLVVLCAAPRRFPAEIPADESRHA
ncbi:MFS transporter [Streptomyces sp. NPDC046261]|uniref:MFS transporter n=1 Tax=Streptomyces sp. NPDC046261 TaxID=3157200 RepID=UPI0033C797E2